MFATVAALAPPLGAHAASTGAAGVAADATLVFSAIADIPQDYTSEIAVLEQQVSTHNTYSPSYFLLHLGDIKGGTEPCEEFRYQHVADILKTSVVPTFVLPGDNDTVDCAAPATGWALWKNYFLRFEEFFCGAPTTERQSSRPENIAFVENGVLFVGLDLVSNDSQIMQDAASWVSAQLQAKKSIVRAAVTFAHIGPGSSSFAPFFDAFTAAAATFGKPVLYLHGHGHSWIQDRPFPTATNVLRTQLERGTSPPVQITVTLDGVNPFQFNRNPWPAGTEPYDRPPCGSGGNLPPVAANDTYEVECDRSLAVAAPGVLANDSDPEGTALTATLVSPPQHGTLALAANGGFSYTPAASYVGQDGFTYRARDGTLTSNLSTVTINVGIRFATFTPTHDTRVSSSSPTTSYGTNTTLRVQTGLTIQCSYLKFDVSGIGPVLSARLRLYVTDGSPGGGSVYAVANEYQGTATPWTETGLLWGNAPTLASPALAAAGAVTEATWTELDVTTAIPGNGTFSLGLDGAANNAAYYSSKEGSNAPQLVVAYRFGAAANHIPVARDDAYVLNEDATLGMVAPGVLANDTDADADPLTASVTRSPAHGSLALQPTGGFTYIPAADWSGGDSFTYAARDGLGGVDVANVQLTVLPLPDAPAAANDSYTLVVNHTLTTAAPGVLANDIDPDGDALTLTLLTGTSFGVLSLHADGSFDYAPNTNFIGSDAFTYQVRDPGGLSASATVSLQVTPPPPVTLTFTAVADAYVSSSKPSSNYGTATTLRLRDSSTDYRSFLRFEVNGIAGTLLSAKLRIYVTNAGSDGGTFHAVSNNALNTSSPWTETGLTWNNAPALVGAPLAVAGTVVAGTWAEMDVTAAILGDGTYCFGAFTRSSNEVAYAARETTTRPELVLLVQENPVPGNRPPVATDDDYSVDEDNVLTVAPPGVLANDIDSDGNALGAANPSAPAHGTLDLRADGSFTYVPAANYNGSDAFTYRATDGLAGSTSATVRVTVRPLNDAPVAAADSWSAPSDAALVVGAPGVLANDTDVDGNALHATLVTGAAHGSLTLAADGSFTYTPETGYSGTDGFTYRASDGGAESAATNVLLTVSGGGPGPGNGLAFEEIQSGGATSMASVTTTAGLAAVPGHLYIAAVASKSLATVTQVTGMGLTWTRVRSQCAGRNQTGVEVWLGHGTPASGNVTASLQSTVSNAVLLVARYSGADAANPIGNIVSGNSLGVNGVCSGGTDTASFGFDLVTTPGNFAFGAVASRSKVVTPGPDFVKRGQIIQGIDSGSMASVSVMDKTATGTPSRVDGTLASATDWAMVAVEIRAGGGAAKLAAPVEPPSTAFFRIYPNPARRGAWIEYRLDADTQVTAHIFNARGQHVRTLAAEPQVAGMWRLYWDGQNEQGVRAPTGIYFARVQVGTVLHTRKIVFEK